MQTIYRRGRGVLAAVALLMMFTAACGGDESASGGGSNPDTGAPSDIGSPPEDANSAGDDSEVGDGSRGASSFAIDGGVVAVESTYCDFDSSPSAEIDGTATVRGTTLNGLSMNFEFTRYNEEYQLDPGDELLLYIDDPDAPGGQAHFAALLPSGTVAVEGGSASVTDATLEGVGDFVEVSFDLSC